MKLKDKKIFFSLPKYLLAIVTCLLIGNTACDKFVEVGSPKDVISTETAFKSDASTDATIRGIYAYAVASSCVYAVHTQLGFSADELVQTSYITDLQEFVDNNLTSKNSTLYSLWKSYYNAIYQCNNALKHIPESKGITPAGLAQYTGEAKFLRAFFYFYLVNLWDSIPMPLTPDYDANRLLPRVSSAEVYAQIVADLEDANNKLSSTLYVTSGTRTRANKWAATALLARVKLYQQKWAEAEAKATDVINKTDFMLPPVSEVFLASSRENILQLTNLGGGIPANVNMFVGNPANPGVRVSTYVANLLITTDLRRGQWLTPTLNGVYKYRGGPTPDAIPVLRLAEMYLIRAEARAQQDNITGANSAATDLNMVRSRAGLAGTTATTKTTMLQAIYDERMIELFGEWGHRWLDVKRTGQADAIFGARKTGWATTDALYPIPYNEILIDVNLTQNPGY